jgi:hypothetical protein
MSPSGAANVRGASAAFARPDSNRVYGCAYRLVSTYCVSTQLVATTIHADLQCRSLSRAVTQLVGPDFKSQGGGFESHRLIAVGPGSESTHDELGRGDRRSCFRQWHSEREHDGNRRSRR